MDNVDALIRWKCVELASRRSTYGASVALIAWAVLMFVLPQARSFIFSTDAVGGAGLFIVIIGILSFKSLDIVTEIGDDATFSARQDPYGFFVLLWIPGVFWLALASPTFSEWQSFTHYALTWILPFALFMWSAVSVVIHIFSRLVMKIRF